MGRIANRQIAQRQFTSPLLIKRFSRRMQFLQNRPQFCNRQKLLINEWEGFLHGLVQRQYWILPLWAVASQNSLLITSQKKSSASLRDRNCPFFIIRVCSCHEILMQNLRLNFCPSIQPHPVPSVDISSLPNKISTSFGQLSFHQRYTVLK